MPDLDGPACPPELVYVLEWYGELAAARGSNGFGVSPISFSEIAAWSGLVGVRPTPFEIGVLRHVDACVIADAQKASKKDG